MAINGKRKSQFMFPSIQLHPHVWHYIPSIIGPSSPLTLPLPPPPPKKKTDNFPSIVPYIALNGDQKSGEYFKIFSKLLKRNL